MSIRCFFRGLIGLILHGFPNLRVDGGLPSQTQHRSLTITLTTLPIPPPLASQGVQQLQQILGSAQFHHPYGDKFVRIVKGEGYRPSVLWCLFRVAQTIGNLMFSKGQLTFVELAYASHDPNVFPHPCAVNVKCELRDHYLPGDGVTCSLRAELTPKITSQVFHAVFRFSSVCQTPALAGRLKCYKVTAESSLQYECLDADYLPTAWLNTMVLQAGRWQPHCCPHQHLNSSHLTLHNLVGDCNAKAAVVAMKATTATSATMWDEDHREVDECTCMNDNV
ncbi:hypothetical protein EI94DRAFT_1703826 [Lactarius quietus]|nr:hypothetical protein EI94DRAFT_1703826 [Lactarius quietus]